MHPVLGQREYHYPGCSFKPNVTTMRLTDGTQPHFCFSADFDCDVEAINRLVEEGSAQFGVWVYCARTAYRRLFSAEPGGRALDASISVTEVRESVDMYPLIVALRDLELPLEQANEAFGATPLRLRAGSPLAVHLYTRSVITDEPEGGTRTIFELAKDKSLARGVWDSDIDPDGAVIKLTAHPNTLEEFLLVRDETWALQALYLPALVEALEAYRQVCCDEGEWEPPNDPTRWTGAITKQTGLLGISLEEEGFFCDASKTPPKPRSVLWAAQKLLKSPLKHTPTPEQCRAFMTGDSEDDRDADTAAD